MAIIDQSIFHQPFFNLLDCFHHIEPVKFVKQSRKQEFRRNEGKVRLTPKEASLVLLQKRFCYGIAAHNTIGCHDVVKLHQRHSILSGVDRLHITVKLAVHI